MLRVKNLFILMGFLSFLCSCARQKQGRPQAIGLGLLTVNTQYPIPLYKNEADDLPFDTLKFEIGKSGKTLFLSGIELQPYLISEGDSDEEGEEHLKMGLVRFGPELKFAVVDTGEKFFRVIGNQANMNEFVIKKAPGAVYYSEERMLYDNSCINCPGSKYNPRWYVFETWERYLKRVEFITKDSLVIYEVPDGKVLFELKDQTFLPFAVTDVKGDWIKVKKGFGRESNFDTGKYYDGWIKWREGTHLLIDITERTYE
ncbi:hypothetical protein [Pedobacter psychroterrae]|uniref:Lipoprotein n=1 Tax=Pedobacter psychroterrae TaxID=2530453 RepID=A0A4R0NQN5_9SPHI|nr:hypothetical protein [Pedobacter psychroterrae]TCD01394.1 hypothetical protein EZ437_11655 [Pedobacter psychroterrae]